MKENKSSAKNEKHHISTSWNLVKNYVGQFLDRDAQETVCKIFLKRFSVVKQSQRKICYLSKQANQECPLLQEENSVVIHKTT